MPFGPLDLTTVARRAILAVVVAGTVVGAQATTASAAATYLDAPGSPFPMTSDPSALAVGDLDGDGKPDIVSSSQVQSRFDVLKGDGAGGFSPAAGSPVATGSGLLDVELVDVNGDGDLDLLGAASLANALAVYLGDGAGGFAAAPGSPFSVGGTRPVTLAAGDFDEDGVVDVVTANIFSDSYSLLLGTGTGAFVPAAGSPFAGGPYPRPVSVGDVNADSHLDVVGAGANGSPVSVLLGDGLGALIPAPGSGFIFGSDGSDLDLGDLDGDSDLDLAITDAGNSRIRFFGNDGSGGFLALPSSKVLSPKPTKLVLFDGDADGALDFAYNSGYDSGVGILLGDGSGAFAPPSPKLLTSGLFPTLAATSALAVADVNGDGEPDLISSVNSGYLSVLLHFGGPEHAIPVPPLAFSQQAVGTLSPARVFSIENTGDQPLHVSATQVIGPDAGDFLVTASTCQGVALEPGDTCSVSVRFAPSAAGVESATVRVLDDTIAGFTAVAVSGTGGSAPTGPQGAAGTNGSNGTNGADGAAGANGAAGTNGADGAKGADGTNGLNGTNGSNGTAGGTGPIGPTGATGARGEPGATGARGATGPPRGATGMAICDATGTGPGETSLGLSIDCDLPALRFKRSVRLTRAGKTVATGTQSADGTFALTRRPGAEITPGVYGLTRSYRKGKRTISQRQLIRIGAAG